MDNYLVEHADETYMILNKKNLLGKETKDVIHVIFFIVLHCFTRCQFHRDFTSCFLYESVFAVFPFLQFGF